MSAKVQEGFVRIENKVYDAEKLSQFHPGGPLFVKAFSGRDASQAFLSYHRREFPHKRAEPAFHAVDESVKYSDQDNKDFLDLCREIEKVLPRMKSFAPWTYFVKIALIIGAALALEGYIHYTGSYKWYLSGSLGILFALIGLNVQHDANHGAVSRNAKVNRVLGAMQNWIGGSAISWIHQHVVQHHVHTNDLELDPDISIEYIVRLNPTHPLLKFHIFQYFYFFVLIAFYGLMKVYFSMGDVMSWSHFTPMSKLLRTYRWKELAGAAIFCLRWILLPLIMSRESNPFILFLNILPIFMTTGYYLSFFFTISHNFKGVHMHESTTREVNSEKSFLYNQVVSSSNVGGSFLCFLNGGLNYQIEHHLFPRINHTHYPLIAPHVRKFCEERKIPYVHFHSITDNLKACVKHLMDLGENQDPKSIVLEKTFKKFHLVS